jgi:WD40 repeat protein
VNILSGHAAGVTGVSWSADGTRLASSSNDGTVRLWDISTGNQLNSIVYINPLTGSWIDATPEGGPDVINDVDWSSTNDQIALVTATGQVLVWGPRFELKAALLGGHLSGETSISWSPDGEQVASQGTDRYLRIWDLATSDQLGAITEAFLGYQQVLAWSPNGTLIGTGQYNKVFIFNSADGSLVSAIPDVYRVEWSPDGTKFVVLGDSFYQIWGLE